MKTKLFQNIPDLKFEVFYKNDLICRVYLNRNTQKVIIENQGYTFPIYPFKDNVTPEDVLDFLEERCIPKSRANIKEILSSLGLSSYDPEAICRKTHGLMFDDYIWIRFPEDGELTYEEVKIRD